MLRQFVIAGIHVYRRVARATGFRRTCLYGVSCSRHVEAIARAEGGREALRAMRVRFANCRPGYTFDFSDQGWSICCIGGAAIASAEASPALRSEADLLAAILVTP